MIGPESPGIPCTARLLSLFTEYSSGLKWTKKSSLPLPRKTVICAFCKPLPLRSFLKNFSQAFPVGHDSAVNVAHHLFSQLLDVDGRTVLIDPRRRSGVSVRRRLIDRTFRNSALCCARGLSVNPCHQPLPHIFFQPFSVSYDSFDQLHAGSNSRGLISLQGGFRPSIHQEPVEDTNESRRVMTIG